MAGTTRRHFLQTVAGGSLMSLGGLGFLQQLRPLSAGEVELAPSAVQFRPEIEPLVQLLEETPREQVLEKFADRIQHGTSYREVLTALLLAGVRNVQPRPSVGHKFHAVLVVNSAHLASLSSPDSDRWLPIFWALDEFKASQSRDVQEGNWTMGALKESEIPNAEKSRELFLQSMDTWDESGADVSIAGLARTAGAHEVFELFARYGIRDFRSIGHKAIYVANSSRTLNCIGWHHAEPVLRSLTYALLNHSGEPNPAESNLAPDEPWRRNQELVKQIRPEWRDGKLDSKATAELLNVLYQGSEQESPQLVVEMLNAGVSPQSIYDALLVGAGELLMRQPGIVGLHAVTTTNAMHYLFQAAQNDETRRLILLQNAAFLPLFQQGMRGRGKVGDQKIQELTPAEVSSQNEDALSAIFTDVSGNRMEAARKTLSYVQQEGQARDFITQARRLIFLKGTNSHDYKFSSAALEDYYHVSPDWRNQFLATSVFNLRGSRDRDNSLVERTRAALS